MQESFFFVSFVCFVGKIPEAKAEPLTSTRWRKGAAALPPHICAFGDPSAIVFGEADPPLSQMGRVGCVMWPCPDMFWASGRPSMIASPRAGLSNLASVGCFLSGLAIFLGSLS